MSRPRILNNELVATNTELREERDDYKAKLDNIADEEHQTLMNSAQAIQDILDLQSSQDE